MCIPEYATLNIDSGIMFVNGCADASALVTPRQQPSATTTELCHTFMDASTQTPMAPGVKPVVLVPKTLVSVLSWYGVQPCRYEVWHSR